MLSDKRLQNLSGSSTYFLSPCYGRLAPEGNPIGWDRSGLLLIMAQFFRSKGATTSEKNRTYYLWAPKVNSQGAPTTYQEEMKQK